MKILLYTQESGAGGSLRMLLNLAEYLQTSHEVSIVFDKNRDGGLFLPGYPAVQVISRQEVNLTLACDVLVAHLPYGRDEITEIPVTRKLIISMEVLSRVPMLIDDQYLDYFDGMLYLHDEQVMGFGEKIRKKCIKMPLINNIKKPPSFYKTGNIGCIGEKSKHNVREIIRVLGKTSRKTKISIWTQNPARIKKGFKNFFTWLMFTRYQANGRLNYRPVEADIFSILREYDLLLHSPSQGNGTSTVVSDALSSGKMVLLSALPAYKVAYGGLPGVYFLDDKSLDIAKILAAYNQDEYEKIQKGYASIYNRNTTLEYWKKVIEGGL